MYNDPEHILGFNGKSGGPVHIEIGIEGAMFFETAIRFMPFKGRVIETPSRSDWNEFTAKIRFRDGKEEVAVVTVPDLYNYPDSEVVLTYKGKTYSALTNLFLVELKSGEVVSVKFEHEVSQLAYEQDRDC